MPFEKDLKIMTLQISPTAASKYHCMSMEYIGKHFDKIFSEKNIGEEKSDIGKQKNIA